MLDDFSRYIVTWKLCTTMKAQDVTDTLGLALQASGAETKSTWHIGLVVFIARGADYVSAELVGVAPTKQSSAVYPRRAL